jgi:hypothetical protein
MPTTYSLMRNANVYMTRGAGVIAGRELSEGTAD